jgi:putative tricarboxylic transport membrane protein
MQYLRKTIQVGATAVAALGILIGAFSIASAAYPEKPITFLIPYGPGGGTDLSSRILCTELEKILGQPVVPTNKGGGGGAVSLGVLYGSEPDGYTIGVGTGSNMTIIPHSTKVQYDMSKFTFVSTYFGWPYYLVSNPSIPANNLSELIAWAKANPGELIVATTGGFNLHVLSAELMSEKAGGIEYRLLPTDSAAASTARVLAGDANFVTGSPATYQQHIRAGKLKALAIVSDISTPEMDAMNIQKSEDILGFALTNTTAVIAPPGLPEDIRATLEAAVKQALENPDVIQKLNNLGLPPSFEPGPQAKDHVMGTYEKYGRMIKRIMARKN